jgi:hypothetical protein
MTLKVEQPYPANIPQSTVSGFAPRGLAWHWTAGGTGRAGAESTIRHFQNTRATVNASYHILLFREGATTVAVWIVPVGRASHSLNPAAAFKPKTGSAREQARFAEVHRILARDSDPNADCISISFCGMPADLAAAMRDPGFVADVRELARQLIAHPAVVDRPHFGHGWIQPTTRYETDATTGGQDLLIAQLYGEVPSPAPQGEDDMQFWRPVQEDWWTVAKTATALGTVFYDAAGNRKEFTSRERVRSSHESSDGRYRLVRYGTSEVLVVDARGNDKVGPGLVPIAGTRVPTTGYGFPPPEVKEVIKTVEVPTGITEDDVADAVKLGATAERDRIAEAEAARIRST